jgi:hypothetical protein
MSPLIPEKQSKKAIRFIDSAFQSVDTMRQYGRAESVINIHNADTRRT